MADPDDLVPFRDVLVLRSTAPALFCRIGERRLWLLRSQVSGKLWQAGDRGRLFVRRSVVVDQGLGDVTR
jgi:hypothetical protein